MESVSNLNGFEEDNDDYIDLPELAGRCDSDSDDDDTDDEYDYNLEEDNSGNKSNDLTMKMMIQMTKSKHKITWIRKRILLRLKRISILVSMHQIDWYILIRWRLLLKTIW